ncbi:MAG: RusA family crossover junction endodeoxyribonuclease [Thermomicrobiales bacterium]
MSSTSEPISIRLTLPLPPGMNNQYVTVGKRRVLSKTAQVFKKDVTKLIAGMREKGQLAPDLEPTLKKSLIGVYLTFYFTTPMRRDLDGGLKIALDTLATNLGFDDRAVVDLHPTQPIDPPHPRPQVELENTLDRNLDREPVYLGTPDEEEPSATPE